MEMHTEMTLDEPQTAGESSVGCDTSSHVNEVFKYMEGRDPFGRRPKVAFQIVKDVARNGRIGDMGSDIGFRGGNEGKERNERGLTNIDIHLEGVAF